MTYARANTAAVKRARKLVQATRSNWGNHVSPLGPKALTEAHRFLLADRYRSDAGAGRVAGRQTLYNPNTTQLRLGYRLHLGPARHLASIEYPRRLQTKCAGNDLQRTVTFTYEDGFLRTVPDYATSLWYQAGGLLGQVLHANGVRNPSPSKRPAWPGRARSRPTASRPG